MIRKTIFFIICISLFIPVSSHAVYFSEHDAGVLYWHEVENGQHYYYYHVINNSIDTTIVAVLIGYDWEYGIPRLSRERGEVAHIPTKFFSPPGWTGKVQYTEETLYYSLEWRTGGTEDNIKPGESSYRFGVELTNQRDDHIDTYFTVIWGDSTITTKKLDSSETKPPPKDHPLSPLYLLLLSKGVDVKFINFSSAG